MTIAQTDGPTLRKPLRLWPGVVLAVLMLLARFGLKMVVPGFKGFEQGMMASLACVLALLVWWVFLSRAPWSERLGAIVLMVAGLAAAWFLKHESMGPLWLVAYAVPVLFVAFVAWAVASRNLADRPRRAALAATILIACGVWTLARTDGITGDHDARFAWRWTESPEERLLALDEPATLPAATAAAKAPEKQLVAQANDEPAQPVAETPEDPLVAQADAEPAAAPAAGAKMGADWPTFRGPGRNGIVRGVRIETDWSASPPVELWRRPIGPGWSSFAVRGDHFYTQEQRGDDEIVSCYNLTTGAPVWQHRDAARFFESNGGAGPRSTPTLDNGRVYTLGATGILNALDAGDGAVLWSRNVSTDTGTKVPVWGFSSSPLIVDDLIIIAASGALAAYDLATGDLRWSGKDGGESYSSPQLLTIDGVEQVLLMSGAGATSVTPADGKLLWEHPWPGFPIVQPALMADGNLLITASGTSGTRRIAVAHEPGGWTVKERWTSIGLKPYFNDFVVHNGHAFGFDGRILACIGLEDGKRKWKGGHYGSGQLVLLPDQDLLLVLSDEGELALVKATTDQFTELARFPAVEGKTWNHPVLAGDVLLVRNGEEMVAFRLALAGR
ncbi:MAG: outer membrane protein assembly factor BamB [Acidobacteriota bacterium]|jgi:outer membrane protein assembly factor BamB|nr:outer membrane protein assembly factor BamB [Acidobacteriota bacterium]